MLNASDKNLIIKTAESPAEFSAIQSIRVAVFQLEQGVEPELDFDGEDETSDQLLVYLDNQVVGTARVRCLNNQTAKIERLAVLPTVRGKGIGKQIMQKAIDISAQKNMQEVVIHAQQYVMKLYQKLGFELEGEVFEEAGIPHVKMRKTLG